MKLVSLNILLLLLSVLLFRCKEQPSVTPRDRSITVDNAVTNLTLDSSSIELFIKQRNLSDSAANRLISFYNSRNYRFAWFNEDGLAEQARSFWTLHNSYTKLLQDTSAENNDLHEEMKMLLNEDTTNKNSRNYPTKEKIETELQLTQHFFLFARYAYTGNIDPEELQWHIPRKKLNVMDVLDSLIKNKGTNTAWEPVSSYYITLRDRLKTYHTIEQKGGWDTIVTSKKQYKTGDSGLAIYQIKKHLLLTGDYSVANDTSIFYTPTFSDAVKRAQRSFGLKEDGIITAAFIKELNVPVQARIRQMLINMERMRWMPQLQNQNFLLANIPEFRLHIFEQSKKIFDINIVVGRAVNQTVIFSDSLKNIVFSPYWNIPPSIVKNEILPAMRRNPSYLARKNMEQTGYNNGLPVIRQKPGGNNSLGRVKFLFPNSYNIYFHDTPAKSLFEEDSRAFSHGCIRLADPKKLASYLLQKNPEWTTEKIDKAMYSPKEIWITLKEPVPVFICYFTAWVDSNGLLNFRDDIYGHDKKMAQYLFKD